MCIPFPKTCSGRSTIRYGKNLSSSLRVTVSYTTRSTCSVLIKSCVNPLCYTHYCVTDLAAFIESKFHFYYHVDYIFSQTVRLLKLFWQQPSAFPTYKIFWYYCTSVKPQFQYVSIVWNYIRPSYTDVSKLQGIQWKLLILLLLLLSSSPLYRVIILIFLRKTMSLENIVLQLFCCYYSWCLYS